MTETVRSLLNACFYTSQLLTAIQRATVGSRTLSASLSQGQATAATSQYTSAHTVQKYKIIPALAVTHTVTICNRDS